MARFENPLQPGARVVVRQVPHMDAEILRAVDGYEKPVYSVYLFDPVTKERTTALFEADDLEIAYPMDNQPKLTGKKARIWFSADGKDWHELPTTPIARVRVYPAPEPELLPGNPLYDQLVEILERK